MSEVQTAMAESRLSFINAVLPTSLLPACTTFCTRSALQRSGHLRYAARYSPYESRHSRLMCVRSIVTSKTDSSDVNANTEGIRVNKCFKSFASRRESDEFVGDRRVTINEDVTQPGARVYQGDVVKLDGQIVDWERLTLDVDTDDFVYIKHWKALDVVCTTDPNIPNNIIDELSTFSADIRKDRVFPVGRLDQMSSGLILLTSDGRLPVAVLGAKSDSEKEYVVTSDMYVSDEHIRQLRAGVVISTVAQRDRNVRKTHVSRTMPCDVKRGEGNDLVFSLREGRNRQLRKMLGALGYTSRAIHRTRFMGISLDGLSHAGDTCLLSAEEMDIVKEKLRTHKG